VITVMLSVAYCEQISRPNLLNITVYYLYMYKLLIVVSYQFIFGGRIKRLWSSRLPTSEGGDIRGWKKARQIRGWRHPTSEGGRKLSSSLGSRMLPPSDVATLGSPPLKVHPWKLDVATLGSPPSEVGCCHPRMLPPSEVGCCHP